MIEPGQRVERWEVLRHIGSGGMADVYEARHIELDTRHALKILHTRSPGVLARMLSEGRIQARLDHPNIVRVTDVVRVGDQPMLVMDYVDGPSLAEWLRERRDWTEVAPIVDSILNAVEAAHQLGVVHRDLKPANVLLQHSGGRLIPKVADFGIAKAAGGEGGTRTGAGLGTLSYMAPEQIRNARDVDVRADVWALGCIVYEAAHGAPAFAGDDPITLYERFLHRGYAPLAGPDAAQRAVHAALEPDRELRCPDVASLRSLLTGGEYRAPQKPVGRTDTDRADDTPLDSRPGVPGWVLVQRIRVDFGTERFRGAASDGSEAEVTIARNDADAQTRERVVREARVLGELHHPRIARLLGSGTLPDGRPWLARTIPPAEPLAEWSKRRRTRDDIHRVIAGALALVADLHALQPPIIIRDWAPERLAVGPDGVWLVDLGLVRDAPNDPAMGGMTFDGTFGFMAPEQLRGDGSPATDVWGIGALAASLMTRRDPRTMRDGERLVWRPHADVPDEWADAVDSMVSSEPNRRPSASAALERWRNLLLSMPHGTPVIEVRKAAPRTVPPPDAPTMSLPTRFAERAMPAPDKPFEPPIPRQPAPLADMRDPQTAMLAVALALPLGGLIFIALVMVVALFSMGPAVPQPTPLPPIPPPAPIAPPPPVVPQPMIDPIPLGELLQDRGVQGCVVAWSYEFDSSSASAPMSLRRESDGTLALSIDPTGLGDVVPLEACLAPRVTQLLRNEPLTETVTVALPISPFIDAPLAGPWTFGSDPAIRACARYLEVSHGLSPGQRYSFEWSPEGRYKSSMPNVPIDVTRLVTQCFTTAIRESPDGTGHSEGTLDDIDGI